MNEFLESIRKRDPAAKSILGIILTYPGVKAVFMHKISRFFHLAGFEAEDVHMQDLLDGSKNINNFNGMAVCGGFSYGDVLGAGGGWSKTILYNSKIKDQFEEFFQKDSTFTLGVCNGCQMLSNIKSIIPGADAWPRFIKNYSDQFESRLVQVEIKNKKILILGAGGAVRGIIGSLIKENPSHIEIANRTISHAEKISKDFSNEASIKTCTIEELNEKGNFDLIINAISFDTHNKDIALSKNIISKSSVCYDLSYNSSPTQFMLWAMKNGANFAIQGWGMLIEQAAESYLIWKKIRPDTSAILKQLNVTSSSQILRR